MQNFIDIAIKTFLLYIIIIYLIGGLISSVGMFIYFKKRQTKYPGLIFIPFYKHFYFEKYMFGFCIARRTYDSIPGILCALNICTICSFLFLGLRPFIVTLMVYLCYRGYLFRGMLKHYGFKYIFSTLIFMTFGGAPLVFIWLSRFYVPQYDLGVDRQVKVKKKRGKKHE